MNEKVDDLRDLLALVVEVVDCTAQVAKDGQLNFSDITAVWSVIEKIGPAMFGIGHVPAELKDLTPDELTDLLNFVKLELDYANTSEAKEVVDKAFKALRACYEAYLAIRG